MLELWILAGCLAAVGLGAVLWLRRRREGGDGPLIAASVKSLKPGLYQVDIKITNRGPRALIGVSLRRLRPRSARLLAPIQQLSTRDGDFQVWADPESDTPIAEIPVDLVLGPWAPPQGVVSLSAEGLVAAWLFLPKASDLARLTLELSMREDGARRRRYRFGVSQSA